MTWTAHTRSEGGSERWGHGGGQELARDPQVDNHLRKHQIIPASSRKIMPLRRYGNVALVLLLGVGLSCSSDTIAGPGRPATGTAFTRSLTSVSGARIPAVYYSDRTAGYRSWADSATATVQADGVIAFHLYESGTSPFGAPHEDQPSEAYFASGVLTSDSTFAIYYSDSSIPDRGTINADGSITVNFTGIGDAGQSLSFGSWVFASPYRGPALNPAPRITGIDPTPILVSDKDVKLTIDGSSFMPVSRVSVGDLQLQSVLVGTTQLQVNLPQQQVKTPGTFDILVTNPGPGGGTYYYPVSVKRAVPTIGTLSPNTVVAGSEIYTVAITGTGFDAGTMVTVNGVMRQPLGPVTPTTLAVAMDPSELAAAGVFQFAVMNPPPGGGSTSSLPFTVTASARKLTSEIVVPVSATILASDPVRSVVYAGEDRFDPAHPNSIIALDGTTGNVLWSIPTRGTPTMLAVSGDGQFLYYAASVDSAMHRVVLATKTVDLTIPMYNTSQCFPQVAFGAVSPGSPHTLVVEQYCFPGLPSGFSGVMIYDDSIARPKVAFDPNSTMLGPLAFDASATALNAFYAGGVYDISVDASGATTSAPQYPNGAPHNSEIAYLNGIVYSTSGPLYNPVTHGQAARSTWFPSTVYSIVPGRDGKTMYAITDRMTLDALDVSQNAFVGNVAVPGPDAPRQHLVRWGSDGVAFISGTSDRGGSVYLVRSDLVH